MVSRLVLFLNIHVIQFFGYTKGFVQFSFLLVKFLLAPGFCHENIVRPAVGGF